MTPYQKFEVRWKFHLHYHQVLILSQNETSIHEEHFACGTFSYHDGFVNENMFKQAHVINKLGRFGTGFPLAPVWQSCGKPSTKFPHGGLVECLFIPHTSYLSLSRNSKFQIFRYFLENSHFFEISGNLEPHGSGAGIVFLHFITFILIFNIRSTRFSVRFLQGHRAKP